jgi:hypothetical protein
VFMYHNHKFEAAASHPNFYVFSRRAWLAIVVVGDARSLRLSDGQERLHSAGGGRSGVRSGARRLVDGM